MEVNFNGSLKHFQSLMSRLHTQHGGYEWALSSGERLVIRARSYSDPTVMLSWVVTIPIDVEGSNKRCALIQAFSRDEHSAVVLFQDSRTISPNPTSLGDIQVLGPDRAIGPPFDQLCQELQRHMNAWAPPPTEPPPSTREARGAPFFTTGDGLDPLDHKIIEVVRQIENEGLKATDSLVALRLSLNPTTYEPYHRITINKRRNKMRDKGYRV